MKGPGVPGWHGPQVHAGTEPLPWSIGSPRFAADEFDRDRRSSPWAGHRWFAYDLVRCLQPSLIVELGTHFGCSFFAMCQAVLDAELDTEVVAVDTWAGDPHAGEYDNAVFEQFERGRVGHYEAVRTRAIRKLFDDAVGDVEPRVDLLHIDGFHSYEAVRHDHETWQPLLAEKSTVLFHDIAPSSGYESARYWAELCDARGGFTFLHSFGLGVLTTDPRLEALLASPGFGEIARYYPAQAAADLAEMRIEDDGRLLRERLELLRQQDQLIADRDEAIAAQARLVDAKQGIIDSQDRLIADRDEAIAAQARLVDAKQAIIDEQDRLIAARDEAAASPGGRVRRFATRTKNT